MNAPFLPLFMKMSACLVEPSWLLKVAFPVQSLFNWYVPVKVNVTIVPSILFVDEPVRFPAPSATTRSTLAAGWPEPFNPLDRTPYTPFSVALLHEADWAAGTANKNVAQRTNRLVAFASFIT